LTVEDDSKLIVLVHQAPPGRLVTLEDGTMVAREEEGEAQWSLNALARAAQEAGIPVKRSQVRRILLRERVRWRNTHSWGTPRDKDFVRNPDGGRHPLHHAPRRVDDHLYRRTRTSSATHL
jgi:type II secretory pathway component PulK